MMSRTNRRVAFGLLMGFVAVMSFGYAWAQATRITLFGQITSICEISGPTRTWMSNGILHEQGALLLLEATEDIEGTVLVEVEHQKLNVATGKGNIHGNWSHFDESGELTFEGRFEARFDSSTIVGTALGHGEGESSGQHVNVHYGGLLTDPGSFAVEATIVAPHGN